MVSTEGQIEDAIQVISHHRAVFTVGDIAAYSNLEGRERHIGQVLQRYCNQGELVKIEPSYLEPDTESHYIRKLKVARWWVRQTLRWASSGINYLTARQLAGAMSLAFDDRRWAVPPQAVLETGRRWALVDDSGVPGTYVLPWVSLLKANPQLKMTFLAIFDPTERKFHIKDKRDRELQQDEWERFFADASLLVPGKTTIDEVIDAALSNLADREAEVIRKRFGIHSMHRYTLGEISSRFGVTRERIRQIEKKGLCNLKNKSILYYGFAAHFVRSGGSLLISELEMSTEWKLLCQSIGVDTVPIPRTGLRVIGIGADIEGYCNYLDSKNLNEDQEMPLFEGLRFLSRQDADRLSAAEMEYQDSQKKYFAEQAARKPPLMVLQAMRSIGRPAHYQEIAEMCNRMFPERQTSIHNWHAVLCRSDSLKFGIVWTGRKGTYGLVEQGYFRPTRGMFDAVASIVEARFSETGRPVPTDFVMRELSKERYDPDPNSVNMALTFNDRLAPSGNGRYVPKASAPVELGATDHMDYDLDAAFDAFLSGSC